MSGARGSVTVGVGFAAAAAAAATAQTACCSFYENYALASGRAGFSYLKKRKLFDIDLRFLCHKYITLGSSNKSWSSCGLQSLKGFFVKAHRRTQLYYPAPTDAQCDTCLHAWLTLSPCSFFNLRNFKIRSQADEAVRAAQNL